MRGLWLEGGDLRLRDDLPEPAPADGEARVRVLTAGVCSTDLELMAGYMPFVGVPGHEFVGVVEDGPGALLGQLIARTLAVGDCALSVVVRSDRARSLLANQGIHTAKASALEDATADLVVECTGNPEGFAIARRLVRPGGTLVMKSTYAGSLTVDASMLVVDEITLVGSRCGPFAPALELLASGAVEVGDLIAARYPLSDGVAAFAQAAQPGVLKVLVEMPAGR